MSEMTCCVCGTEIEANAPWIGHQRLGVRWHGEHGVEIPICGEDVSNHCLRWENGAYALAVSS